MVEGDAAVAQDMDILRQGVQALANRVAVLERASAVGNARIEEFTRAVIKAQVGIKRSSERHIGKARL